METYYSLLQRGDSGDSNCGDFILYYVVLIELETISVITNDGRNIIGVLKGFDQCVNLILDDSFERVFSLKEPVEAVELGLYIVRGDNISVIGGVPENIREQVIDDQTRAAPLKPLVH